MVYIIYSDNKIHERSKTKVEHMLASGKKTRVLSAFLAAYEYGNSYSYALELCQRLYRHEDVDIRKQVLIALPVILLRFGRINLELVVEVLKAAFKETDKEAIGLAYELFEDMCHNRPKRKHWIKKQLPGVDLTKYDYMFASKSLIKKQLAKRTAKERELKFCCDDMHDAIKSQLIEYEMTTRDYCINVSDKSAKTIKFCPWCGMKFKNTLIKEYFDILKQEYGIEVPDIQEYTNIPDEFISDEWWRKRGL